MMILAATIDTILLAFIAAWLFLGGTLLGWVIFKTHEAVNSNFQKQQKMLETANGHIARMASERAAPGGPAPVPAPAIPGAAPPAARTTAAATSPGPGPVTISLTTEETGTPVYVKHPEPEKEEPKK